MLQCEIVKDDELPSNTLEHFVELEQVLQMIDSLRATDAPGFEKDFEKYTTVLSRYQEQPHLLDPHVDILLGRLLDKIRNRSNPETVMHAAFKYLYIICKVRTYKILVKFLPHELSDLDFALDILEQQDPIAFKNWETRYVLLLWLSILVLNPFHMSRLDAYTTQNDAKNNGQFIANSKGQQKTKMERIHDLCKTFTSSNDTCSNISAFLAAKFFVRADMKDLYLESFLDWVISQHQSNTVDCKFGQLEAVAAILKHGKREDLLPYADKLLHWIINCQYKDDSDFLKYKCYMKIIQRIGLVYLKPRVANWRYKRGTRSLAMNLNQVEFSTTPNTIGDSQDIIEEYSSEEEILVPDAIEEVVEELLQGLRSGGSEIRWSAAKGLGRVANRLSKELADDIIGSVVDALNPLEPHEAWHGACLALAELAKRGLLLPYRLQELVPLLMKALFYDEMKGHMSVGQHIRDAACYMCWAFARAYNSDDLQPFVNQISAGLLIVAVFDREINCRRAASAAFQESVGRLGNFPYGIEISTTTDFYSVGLRQNSFLNISDFIAQFEEYRKPLIDHLVERKVNHWDIIIRELSAKALHKLTHHAPEYMATIIMDQLFTKTDSIDINTRHGSVLALGEITLALSKMGTENLPEERPSNAYLSNQTISNLNELITKFLQRDLFRGMSGELMKQCCTDFIKNCSLATIEVSTQCLDSWQAIIDKCLINKTAPTRESATEAFAQMCKAYYDAPQRTTANDEIIRFYLKGAESTLEEHIRMGYISALGSLPHFMVCPHIDAILDSLTRHSLTPLQIIIEGGQFSKEFESVHSTQNWSEARRDSVKALSKLVETVGYNKESKVSFANTKYLNKVLDCLLKALDEYTLDNRGDIGAWVREAAMNAIYQLLKRCPMDLLQANYVHEIVLSFMQQAVEKIDRTRGLAGRLFCQLIHLQPEIPHIRHHQRLKETFPDDANTILWLFADHTFPLFCSLLDLTEYSQRLLLGLSASIGQLTESLIKYSSAALFQFLRHNPSEIQRLCREMIENFEKNLLNERVTYPMLNFFDIVISSGTINSALLDETSTFADDLYRLLNLEIKGFKKLYKIVSSINVYCQLVQVPHLRKKVLSKLSVFLGLTHVHIRKTTATKLYEALALHGDVCNIPEENMDEVLNLLSETDWGLPLLEVRPIRNELCRLMDIKPPQSAAVTSRVAR
uniref:Tubulin-specific chaperone D n=1 Tax=Glossina brevipalpis TaxID=37001 RepID=A0A1A9WDM9_9MUSC